MPQANISPMSFLSLFHYCITLFHDKDDYVETVFPAEREAIIGTQSDSPYEPPSPSRPWHGHCQQVCEVAKPFKLEKVRQLAKLGVSTNKSTSTLTWNDLQSILSIDIDECYFGFYLIRLVEHKPQTPPLLSPLP